MIKIENLIYKYEDETLALNNINMDFDKGQIVGVIGANGAGKSTLFLNILGLLKPTSGKILVEGKSLEYSNKFMNEYRQKVNMVFQDPDKQIFFSRVYDDVAFALRNIGLSEEEVEKRVLKSLEDTKILHLKEKPVHFLSYGQKKRVAIAGVLAMNCELIMLDEPTAGLDPEMVENIFDLIMELKDAGKKIIISSHDMDFIYRVCDYIYILKKGEILVNGSKKEVFLQEDLIKEAGLVQPFLVRLHEKGGLGLHEYEDEAFKEIKNLIEK